MKRAVATGAGVLILLAGGYLLSPIHRVMLPVGTGFAATQLCAFHFVSGFSPDRARSLYIDPILGRYAPLVQVRVMSPERRATASVFGLYARTAVYRPGLGCTLFDRETSFDAARVVDLPEPNATPVNAAHRDAHFDAERLDVALRFPFVSSESNGRDTLAVVVFHRGELVAERYAQGVDPTTPLLGWSMTKTALAALAGALVRSGEIAVDQTGLIDSTLLDGVSLDHLLRMTSGIDHVDSHDPFDQTAVMMYLNGDMHAYARRAEPSFAPGEKWAYSSFNSVLAMGLLTQGRSGDVADHARMWRERVFEPACMSTAIIQPDAAGSMYAGGYGFASAQDWARLGQLFLDGGGGCAGQVFDPDWVDYVTTPTQDSDGEYGAGVWLGSRYDFNPADAYAMRGSQGQVVWIVPSHQLVVAHLAATTERPFEAEMLLAAVINTMREEEAEE